MGRVHDIFETMNDFSKQDDGITLRANHRSGLRCSDCGRMLRPIASLPATRSCPNKDCDGAFTFSRQGRSIVMTRYTDGDAGFVGSAVEEEWDTDYKTPEKRKGMWDGWSVERLRSELHRLKKSGPHDKDSKEATRMKQIMFALRAKGAGGEQWGKVEK